MAQKLDKVSSNNESYELGDLSNYPESLDTEGSLYTAVNSGITQLTGPISFESSFVPVKDSSTFPSQGLLVIDEEVIYYDEKGPKSFNNILRGFAGKRSPHEMGANTKAAVCSDHHNAIRDSILNTEAKIGLKNDPSTSGTIFGRMKNLEDKFLTLKSIFSAHHYQGQPGDIFSFKDRSIGSPISWFWDFGDGQSSTERNPTHKYEPSIDGSYKEYTISLLVTDITGATSGVKKESIIKIGVPEILIYSEKKVYNLLGDKASVTFSDQSRGISLERKWSFGDGTEYATSDPAENQITHTYSKVGSFEVSLVSKMAEGSTDTIPLVSRGSYTVEIIK